MVPNKEEDMEGRQPKAKGMGLPESLRNHQEPQLVGIELWNLVFSLLFSVLLWSSLSQLCPYSSPLQQEL